MFPLTEEVGEGFEGLGLGVVEGASGDAEKFDEVFGTAPVEVTFGEEEVGAPAFFEWIGITLRCEGVEGALEGFAKGKTTSGGGWLVAFFLPVGFYEGNLSQGQFSHAAGIVPGFEGLVDGGSGERGGGWHYELWRWRGRFSANLEQVGGRVGAGGEIYCGE